MIGIEYLDFQHSDHDMDAWEILKQSENEKVKNDEYCEFFISSNRFGRIFTQTDRQPIDCCSQVIENFIDKKANIIDMVDYLFFVKNPYGMIQGENINIPFYLLSKYGFKSVIINMFQECATTTQAMELSKSLIAAGQARKTMILSVSHLGSEHAHRYIETSIMGDGVGLMVIGEDSPCMVIDDFHSKADGSFSKGALENQNRYSPLTAIKNCSEVLSTLMQRCGNPVSKLALQNVSYTNAIMVSKYIDCKEEMLFLDNMSLGGHLADVDTIRNLYDLNNQQILASGDYALISSIGNMRPGLDNICNAVLLRMM
jgi:3-oxoacyl-[acyl-carrier-protein] synthase-3